MTSLQPANCSMFHAAATENARSPTVDSRNNALVNYTDYEPTSTTKTVYRQSPMEYSVVLTNRGFYSYRACEEFPANKFVPNLSVTSAKPNRSQRFSSVLIHDSFVSADEEPDL